MLPLVQTAAAFNDPVPLPEAVKSLLRFVIRVTGAADGALIVRHTTTDGHRIDRRLWVRWANPPSTDGPVRPLARRECDQLSGPDRVERLRPRDDRAGRTPAVRGRANVASWRPRCQSARERLSCWNCSTSPRPASPTTTASSSRPRPRSGPTCSARRFAERQTHQLLFDAVEAALKATTGVTDMLADRMSDAPPPAVIERLKQGPGRGRERRRRPGHNAAAGGGGAQPRGAPRPGRGRSLREGGN